MPYNMKPGSKEKNTDSTFSEAQWNRLTEKFKMVAIGPASISGVTGNRVDVPGSIKAITGTYEDPNERLKALKDLYGGLSSRSQKEVKSKLGPYSGLF